MIQIPVFTFHSVTQNGNKGPWTFLSLDAIVFKKFLDNLVKNEFITLSMQELYSYKQKKLDLDTKKRYCLIHFDDGFLDNYVYVYPMLKEYGFKATVFVSPEFVDPRKIKREFLYLNGNFIKPNSLESYWGYMSWDELYEIDKSGIIDVQSHGMSHTWYPISQKIIDFRRKNDRYFWVDWNKNVEEKPFWLNLKKNINLKDNYPIFEHGKSIAFKKFVFDEDKYTIFQTFLDTIKHKKSKEKLKLCKIYLSDNPIGKIESDCDYEKRLNYELGISKSIIENNLDKKIHFFAWPGGGKSEIALTKAKEFGYLAVTKKGKVSNDIHDDSFEVYRVGGWSGYKIFNKCFYFIEKIFFLMQLSRIYKKGFFGKISMLISDIHRKEKK